MWLFILGIVLFIALILVHEWGHFKVAKRNGVEVEEFGLFFPPRAKVLTRRDGTIYTLNWLPLGGFVKLKGENDADRRPGSFGSASLWAKAKIMLAGVAMNLLAAYVLLVILALIGMPKLFDNQFSIDSDATYMQHAVYAAEVASVEPGSPASEAGLDEGDILHGLGVVGGEMQPMTSDGLSGLTETYAGQAIVVSYEREGERHTAETTLRSQADVAEAQDRGETIGYLGAVSYLQVEGMTVFRSTWSAPVVAGGTMAQFTGLTMQGLGRAVAGLGGIIAGGVTGNNEARQAAQAEASSQVSGPVGVFYIMKEGTTLGVRFVLMIIAIISLSLAIMNALPIPALDGGRLFVLLVSRALRRPLSPQTEEIIHGTGFFLLIGLIVLISVVDVQRFF